jgi:hypothetical protein
MSVVGRTPKAFHSKAQGREAHPGFVWPKTAKPQRGFTNLANLNVTRFWKVCNAFGVIISEPRTTQGAPLRGDPGLWCSTALRLPSY